MKKLILPLFIISSSAFAGMSNTITWNREAITVCFGSKDIKAQVGGIKNSYKAWKESDKAEIIQSLQQEFTPERTGYHFVGFEDCDKNNKPQVMVMKTSLKSLQAYGKKGAATVGMQVFSYPVREWPTVKGIVALSPLGIQHSTITHEFGHILGLMHEHEHPDAYELSQNHCGYYSRKPVERKRYHIYTDFDEVSVMNYCEVVRPGTSKKGLSDGDVNHIRVLYQKSSIREKRTFID